MTPGFLQQSHAIEEVPVDAIELARDAVDSFA